MNDMILDIRKDPYNYVMRVVFCRWKPFILQAMDTDEVTNFSRFIKQREQAESWHIAGQDT